MAYSILPDSKGREIKHSIDVRIVCPEKKRFGIPDMLTTSDSVTGSTHKH